MHLTGGQYKGIKIEVPKDVKPTLSKVRQGVFNMLSCFKFKNNTFLDMFSGSGLMSLEALSRGYNVFSIEFNKKNAKIISKNYKKLNLKPNVMVCDSLKVGFVDKFDIIYLDPPWNYDYQSIILKAYSLLAEDGVIVVEFDETRHFNISDILNKLNLDLKIIKEKKYGRCLINFLG